MPTARELLEQADALMRRNRKRDKGRLDRSTLTGVLEARDDLSIAPTVILPEAPGGQADAIVLERGEATPVERVVESPATPAGDEEPMALDSLGDVPVLTDIVEDWPEDEGRAAVPSPSAESVENVRRESAAVATDAFPASDSEAAALAGNAPAIAVLERQVDATADTVPDTTMTLADDSIESNAFTSADAGSSDASHAASKPEASGPFLDDDFILEIPPIGRASKDAEASPPLPPAPAGSDGGNWNALAEELRMQVLQRLDLFTDTGLREQLGARLSPIVERASAQLIETINRELGELVRGYVAEAIEREIETWRNRSDQ